MIKRDEIEAKASELDIHVANVERDYVFGWLLKALFMNEFLSQQLVFKGGNCMRKAYYPDTRFSSDLDFSVLGAVDAERFRSEINNACQLAQDTCGVQFLTERTSFEADKMLDAQRQSYKGRVYFKDFHGDEEKITISVRLDMTELDKVLLPTVHRTLIHPYSDGDLCVADIPCMALEELVANKLKCLLQRRHSYDLYDFVYATFFERSVQLDRGLVLRTFLRKTIFEPSPGAAKEILLGLPVALFRGAWEKYIVCPLSGRLDFDKATEAFVTSIEDIFGGVRSGGWGADAFFPSHLRNLIFEAGTKRKLLKLTYDGRTREVEPYSLAYKRRRDGHAAEYFYAFDRTGGHTSGPRIKSFVRSGIQDLELTDEAFEPQYPIELSKAGEVPGRAHFARPGFGRGFTARRTPSTFGRRSRVGPRYRIECPYCNKRFSRSTPNTALNPHKDPNGYPCAGRVGYLV